MKANTPEKIYIACDVITEEGRAFILEKPVSYLKSVEYIRTDAFIEKAWNWIEDNLLSSNQQDESCLYFEKFKKHLEE